MQTYCFASLTCTTNTAPFLPLLTFFFCTSGPLPTPSSCSLPITAPKPSQPFPEPQSLPADASPAHPAPASHIPPAPPAPPCSDFQALREQGDKSSHSLSRG